MAYETEFLKNAELIADHGIGNAHLVWALGLLLDEPDIGTLASDALTDGPNDKKIDFIHIDPDTKRLVLAQGYFAADAKDGKDAAPANKASDLNTAVAWLLSGDTKTIPDPLRAAIVACRTAIEAGDIEDVELLYVHNRPESINVARELDTVAEHLRKGLAGRPVQVQARELGLSAIEALFKSQTSHIAVREQIICPAKPAFWSEGPGWRAVVVTVPGKWLNDLFGRYGQNLFSANYRGFLGTQRRKINSGIRASCEKQPDDFWVFNNGITILTLSMKEHANGTSLDGLSIINGAQTTGAIGTVDSKRPELDRVRVLCRIIECTANDKVNDIVRFNNTQNEITSWDQYSNDPEQQRLIAEFKDLGHAYSSKRGFRPSGDVTGIEEVAQPLLAFHGENLEAARGRSRVFDRRHYYDIAFKGIKARHVLFVHALARAVDNRRTALKSKSSAGGLTPRESKLLELSRSVDFKHFIVAVTAQVLPDLLGVPVDPRTVAFSPETSRATNKTRTELAAAWVPAVEAVLAFSGTILDPRTFEEVAAKRESVAEVAEKVGAFLVATNLDVATFKTMVSAS